MLLVNSFRPIQKNYTNQDSNKSNLRQSHFQSKADSVYFTSMIPEATKKADAQLAALTQKYLREYPDIFGAKFKEVFTEPVNEFLNQHGISIKHTPLENLEIVTNRNCMDRGVIKNAYEAYLIDKTGFPIHPIGDLDGESVSSVTANAASAIIFNKLINRQINIQDGKDPFKGKEFPEKLVAISTKVKDALKKFYSDWIMTEDDNNNLKAEILQNALKMLMPEK